MNLTSRDVVLYTRPGCIFCQQVQELLRDAGVIFRVQAVNERSQQEELAERFAARSFPIVVVDGIYLGGFTHIVHLHSSGRLARIGRWDDDGELQEKQGEYGDDPDGPEPIVPPSRRESPLAKWAALGEYMQKRKRT